MQIKVINSDQDCETAIDLKYWMRRHASCVMYIHVCTSCILECAYRKAFFSTNLTKAIHPALLWLRLSPFPRVETRFNTHRVRLSPFPRVETRFNTHNQNAFANAFLELLRLSSISQNHEYEYTVRPNMSNTNICPSSCEHVSSGSL